MSNAAWMHYKEAAAVEEAASHAMNLIRTFGEMDPHDDNHNNNEDKDDNDNHPLNNITKSTTSASESSPSSSTSRSSTNTENPWRHPEQILAELDEARNTLTAAWDRLRARIKEEEEEDDDDNDQQNHQSAGPVSSSHQQQGDDFREAYMNLVTDAFSDVLEDLRNGKEDIDVDVLVDCLQSGMDLMSSQDDRDLFLLQDRDAANSSSSGRVDANNDMTDDDDEQDGMNVDEDSSKLTPHERRRRQLGFHVEAAV